MAQRQELLAHVGQHDLTGQHGGVGVVGVLVDDVGIAGSSRAVLRDGDGKAAVVLALGFIDRLGIAQRVEVPDHGHADLALFDVLDIGVGGDQAALLGQLGEEVHGGLQVGLVAAIGHGAGQHAHIRLGGLLNVADPDLVVAFQQLGPGGGGGLDVVKVGHEGGGAGVGHDPLAVGVLGIVGNGIPGAGLEGQEQILLHGHAGHADADVADVGVGLALQREAGKLLGGGHVGVGVLDAIGVGDVSPQRLPVGPLVRHADGEQLALALSGGNQFLNGHRGGGFRSGSRGGLIRQGGGTA